METVETTSKMKALAQVVHEIMLRVYVYIYMKVVHEIMLRRINKLQTEHTLGSVTQEQVCTHTHSLSLSLSLSFSLSFTHTNTP